MTEHYAGDNVASYCTKCKLNLDHAIVAMLGEVIAKVKCKTCGSVHKFRDPAVPHKTSSSRTRKTTAAAPSASATWEAALADAKGREQVYSMTAKFKVGDVVNHDRFGKGIVQKIYMNKCDVLFQDKERLMASSN